MMDDVKTTEEKVQEAHKQENASHEKVADAHKDAATQHQQAAQKS